LPSLPPPSPEEQVPADERLVTRADWAKAERRWARARKVRRFTMSVIVLGILGVGGYFFWLNKDYFFPPSPGNRLYSAELEPNNKIREATPILLKTAIRGVLGARRAHNASDYDWYRFKVERKQRFSFKLKPPSALNLELGLYRLEKRPVARGRSIYSSKELISVDNRLRGGVEFLPSYLLEKGEYYVLVRELVVPGEKPQENKGDYQLWVEPLKDKLHIELEPNDTVGESTNLTLGKVFEGHHNSKKDIDFYRIVLPIRGKRRAYRYRLRYYAGSWKPSIQFLKRNGRPISIRGRMKTLKVLVTSTKEKQKNKKRKRKRRSSKRKYRRQVVYDYYFSLKGLHYLKIRTKGRFDEFKPYRILLKKR